MMRRLLFPDGDGGTPPEKPAPAASAAPAPAGGGDAGGGVSKPSGSAAFEAEMDGLAPEPPVPGKQPTGAAAPPAGQKKPATSVPAAKPSTKPAPTKPASAPSVLDWKTAPQQFRTAHEKLQEEHARTTTQLQTELTGLRGKMSDYEKRRYLTPDQEQHYTNIEKRAQELEANLYSRDYRESPEFANKFEKPWKAKYGRAIEEIKSLKITYQDGDETKTRDATKADFDRVLGTDSVIQARRLAHELFGEDSAAVLQFRADLREIEEAGNQAVVEKRNGWDGERKKFMDEIQSGGQKLVALHQAFDQAIVQKYPDFFGEDPDNPEANTAMQKGLEFVDNAVNTMDARSEDGAKTSALMRRWAAAWPRDQVIIKQLRAEKTALEEELAKYRGSAPGGEEDGGGGGGTGGGSAGKGGSDQMAEMFDEK